MALYVDYRHDMFAALDHLAAHLDVPGCPQGLDDAQAAEDACRNDG